LAIDVDEESIAMLKRRYNCPRFRILVIGRANAGKTTILEKVCGVAQGTKPIIIKHEPEDKPEAELKPRFKLSAAIKKVFSKKPVPAASATHLTPSMEVSCMVKHIVPTYSFATNFRGAYMILRTRSPTQEATSSSMTLGVLKLVQVRRWRLFGNSLRNNLLQLS
jgi:hypothetical protein